MNRTTIYSVEQNGELLYTGYFKNKAYEKFEKHKKEKGTRLLIEDDIGTVVLKKVGGL